MAAGFAGFDGAGAVVDAGGFDVGGGVVIGFVDGSLLLLLFSC
jgi:hypothetical protein